jgi:hypothetical protein
MRTRVRNRLRQLERRWRQAFPQPPVPWTAPPGARVVSGPFQTEITVESVGQLRAVLPAGGTTRALDVTVTSWRAPMPGWAGRLGPVPGLVSHSVRLPEQGRGTGGTAHVQLAVAEPVPVSQLVVAVLAALEPVHPLPAAVRADVSYESADGARPPWLPLELSGPRPDVYLEGSRYGLTAPCGNEVILVDATAANPRGRSRPGPELPTGVLTLTGNRWQIGVGPVVVAAGRVGDPLDGRLTAALARLGSAVVAAAPVDVPPAAQAAAIAQLAMTGLVLHAELAKSVGKLLAPELVSLLQTPLPGRDTDPVEWELRSVGQRREALRRHATAFALPYRSLGRLPSVSALLVSRRADRVAEAVAALDAQSYPDLEIVVGLHGIDAPAGLPDRVVVRRIPEALSFGEALAEATRAASGSLVTKVDDDDRYGPEHVWDLVLARYYSGATVAGKAAEFVYLAPYGTTIRRRMASEVYSDVVAGGTLLLSRGDLEDVGGWRPVPKSVDRALLDRVLHAGGLVYRTHPFGFVYTRYAEGHTWDPGMPYFLRNPHRHWPGLPPYREFG